MVDPFPQKINQTNSASSAPEKTIRSPDVFFSLAQPDVGVEKRPLFLCEWSHLQQREAKLRQKRLLLEGQHQSIEQQRKEHLKLSIDAQDRIQAGDFVKEILGRLQQREHERAVGAYEQLLGAFLSDVLPGERQIVLDLHTDRSAPALDVYIKKGENMPLEDAWLGTGGSVTNLLSTGLRLVALLRSGQRRFLVLDESDCWIEPALIPKYATVVAQMSHELGVQILMISHHEESLFEGYIPHRLALQKLKSGMLTSEWTPTSDIPVWNDDQLGLRSIGLKDFQSHQNTIIPLSPNVTLLRGKNDIGKSAVVNALRAVFDGDANDTLIKHHAAFAQVTLDFGPEHLLTWQRFKKGKVKTSYKLLNVDSGETLHATDGTKVPDWLTDHLKVGKVEGLDIQIGQQQDPVFLLNQPASTRAKALSIGQESGHVNAMMLLDRAEFQDAKSTLKTCEKELEQARRKLSVLSRLKQYSYDEVDEIVRQGNERTKHIETIQQLLTKWNIAQKNVNALDVSFTDINLPILKSPAANTLLQQWKPAYEVVTSLQKIETPFYPKCVPQMQALQAQHLFNQWVVNSNTYQTLRNIDTNTVLTMPNRLSAETTRLLQRWIKAMKKYNILQQQSDAVLEQPQVNASVTAKKLLDQWATSFNQQKILQNNSKILDETIQKIEQEIETQFPACPTCKRSW